MVDENGQKMVTHCSGIKPFNFEHAEQLVVLGRFSVEQKIFLADEVRTKCPSKYQKEEK